MSTEIFGLIIATTTALSTAFSWIINNAINKPNKIYHQKMEEKIDILMQQMRDINKSLERINEHDRQIALLQYRVDKLEAK